MLSGSLSLSAMRQCYAAALGWKTRDQMNGRYTSIAGPNGTARTVRLLIDTGATALVLPASMISELGFAPEDLHAGIGRGVGGQVPTLVGMLRVVSVGAASADNIRVNFVPDENLRGTKLLGMSFLRHFRMTIDDQRNELVLLAK